ncbi:MAG TPA: MFS transporter [Candidatus Limnocylindrales bacterium]
MSIARTYRELLRNGPLTRLLLGEFVSSIGDWLYLVALVVLVYKETQDPVVLGIVGAARMLPYIVLSIPAGVIADRFDRRMVLLVSDLARAACMVVMAALVAFNGPLVVIAAVAILAACFSTFFYPAIGALVPSLVGDEREFGPANSAWATLDNLAWIVGPGVAGLLLATGDLAAAFMINAVSFTVIAAVLWSLPPSRAAASEPAAVRAAGEQPTPGGVTPAPPATRRILGRDVPTSISLPVMAGVILMDTATWFTFGGIGILIVVIAVDVFHGGDAATGYLNAALGVGGTVGALLSGALVLRPRLGPVLIAGGSVLGIATIALGLSSIIGVAFVAIAVASAGNLILDVSRTTILQRAVPDAFRGRVNGLLYTTQSVSESSGTLVIPILVSGFGFGIVMGVAGIAVIVATVGAVLLIAGAGNVAPGPYDAELRRIARLPLFGGLSPARVEGALLGLTARTVVAGEVVIRQGEPADRFYIIESGAFEVTQAAADAGGDVQRLRILGRDEVFGERGILAKAPRSASVTAATDGLVFAMDGDAFLRLVGARGAVADRLLALYDTPVAEVAARS